MKNDINCNFRIKIILSRPRNPGNIGAAARAMANFGLDELAVVVPHGPVWREAVETAAAAGRPANTTRRARPARLVDEAGAAVGAADIMGSAGVFSTLAQAASDCRLLLGTSALQRRAPDRDIIPLQGLRGYMAERLGNGQARKAGILFGSEKSGLANAELSLCHAVINIPACEKQPSVNLGQAVALVCYELACSLDAVPRAARRPAPLPPVRETERVVSDICALLEEADGPGRGSRYAEDIRRGLLDARLTKSAMGVLKKLLLRARREM